MNGETYDVVVMGTGITESMLSGLCSLEGMKVLHVDSNPFYGADGASLNITALWKRFGSGEVPPELLPNRDWNIDLIPKFIMASGKLVKIIVKTKVTPYLSWKPVNASYVYQWQKGGLFSAERGVIEKIPSSDAEALASNLMSLFEKRRCQKFFQFAQAFEAADAKTWKKCDPRAPFGEVIAQFGLEENTVDFIGHAVALYTSDEFLARPALEVLERVKLYMDSVGRYSDSHFIYPFYGLAGIPESFARKCAVYGGTFMLNVAVRGLEFDAQSGLWTVRGEYEGKEALCRAKKLIANPSYLEAAGLGGMLRGVGVVRRVICILDHPVPNTRDVHAAQIIIPQRQTGRKSDIFIVVLGAEQGVCKKGFFLAIISSTLEQPNVDDDLRVAFGLLGPVRHRFVTQTELKAPRDRSFPRGLFVTDTLDATSHFEAATENVIDLYRALTGKELDLSAAEGDAEGL